LCCYWYFLTQFFGYFFSTCTNQSVNGKAHQKLGNSQQSAFSRAPESHTCPWQTDRYFSTHLSFIYLISDYVCSWPYLKVGIKMQSLNEEKSVLPRPEDSPPPAPLRARVDLSCLAHRACRDGERCAGQRPSVLCFGPFRDLDPAAIRFPSPLLYLAAFPGATLRALPSAAIANINSRICNGYKMALCPPSPAELLAVQGGGNALKQILFNSAVRGSKRWAAAEVQSPVCFILASAKIKSYH